ncbi:NADPH:quinone reductase-like Zn-dependent oxidoreductase [Azoarcus indigens]|uniref:NADPH:quinone reductase-like Zn-dependent oxidoreductase n=1 Tax=Azoarcus indigens TaxID=29545 RepID=A0A4R6DG55_9RHOO|nr:NADPH:quinone reductase-like Zn-dependent oxidoreductase [Azoarcus indigens]
MTIGIGHDERTISRAGRLGVNRVELEADLLGELLAVDGRPHWPLLGRVLRNGPESDWVPGQLLACNIDHQVRRGEIIDVDARRVLAVPAGMEADSALQMPLRWPLLHAALCGGLRLQAGESLLVHQGDGELGLSAIRLAVSLDCSVMAVCADRAGIARALAAGAAETARYGDDWPTLLREHGAVDAVLDFSGGACLQASLPCAKRGARLGALDLCGARPPIAMAWPAFWQRQASLASLDWSPMRQWHIAEIAREAFMRIHDGEFNSGKD